MISKVITANSDGRIILPAGYAFELRPYEDARWPLTALVRFSDQADATLILDEDRPLYMGAEFTRVDILDAPASSKWFLLQAERPQEVIGPQRSPGQAVRLFTHSQPVGTLESGLYNLSHLGKSEYVYDVRAFRQVLLTVTAATINVVSGTEMVTAFISLTWGRSDGGLGLYAGESVQVGDGTDSLASAALGVYGASAEVGEGIGDKSTARYTTRSGRFPYAKVTMNVTGGPVDLTSPIIFNLWGFR